MCYKALNPARLTVTLIAAKTASAPLPAGADPGEETIRVGLF